MRLLHTADWHLGRLFHGVSLVDDQAHLLEELTRLVAESAIDAVLIAGDVYDRAVPPPDAVTLFDAFLARVAGEQGIPVVVIAGNHDSADRLGFGARLLAEGGLHVRGRLDANPEPIELGDAHGPVDFVALPFVDPPHARATLGDAELRDHDACNAAMLSRARGSLRAGRRSVCVAHAFVAGASDSESERPLVVGGGGQVSASHFDGFDYVALGHLHRPQRVARDTIRYSGSLMPYSFGEAAHDKSVSIVELSADGSVEIEPVALSPRRAVRVVEGALATLLETSPDGVAADDYLLVRLTDSGALFHPMARLRERFPNVLQIERPALEAASTGGAVAVQSLAPRAPEDLFTDFFEAVLDREMDEEERAALSELDGSAVEAAS
ncbi:MAG: exonuclease SbcCD subunit D [Myxococcota bacterium]